MRIRNVCCAIVVVTLPGAICLAGDQEMVAKARAAREAAAPPSAPAAGGLDQEEHAARAQAAVAAARLELVLARKALNDSNFDVAGRKARSALRMLDGAKDAPDAAELELQAEGVLARVERNGGVVHASDNDAKDTDDQPAPMSKSEIRHAERRAESLEHGVPQASHIARNYSGADNDFIDTTGNPDAIRDRAIRAGTDHHRYRPGHAIIDTCAILDRDHERLAYQGALREMYRSDEARLLTEVDEARVAPEGWVSYPDNWPEIVAKREKYRGGEIARTPSWKDNDGREWHMAIYDISDLIYVPPDFYFESLDPRESLRNTLDREALRWRSEIFSGYPEDLAAGIPLLRFFGGVDDFAYRGPKYSLERQAQIVDTINAFLKRQNEAAIIPIAPPR